MCRKLIQLILTLVVLAVWTVSAFAQTRVDGRLYSQLYAWENASANQQWDYYQGLQLRVAPSKQAGISLKTHFLVTRRGDPAAWHERFYNAYADWASSERTVQVRMGRQFIYSGVINGSVDGVMVRARPTSKWDLRLVGGTAVPYHRPLKVQSWEDGGTIGGYAAYQLADRTRIDLSLVSRTRQDEVVWRQLGTSLTGTFQKHFYYQLQLDYNLEKSEYQGVRGRLSYQVEKWILSGEYNTQKPRIYEDSFFNIFKLVAFNQTRLGVTRLFGKYQVGIYHLHTMYDEDESTDELMLTAGSSWGTVGVVYQTGFGGDNIGLYGEVRYEFVPGLTFTFHSSHYSYRRRSIAFNEEATAFSSGLQYRPVRALLLQAQVQESMNSFYDNNLRGLFRINYTFSQK